MKKNNTNNSAEDFIKEFKNNRILIETDSPGILLELILCYMFMCYPDAEGGDVEFVYTDGSRSRMNCDSMPENFSDFLDEVMDNIDTTKVTVMGYNCSINVFSKALDRHCGMPLVSSNYYTSIFGDASDFDPNAKGGVLLHTTGFDEEAVEKILKYLFESDKNIEDIHPVKRKNSEILINRAELKCKPHGLHVEKSEIDSAMIYNGGTYKEYYCHRADFGFWCTNEITCCGECPMLKESYRILLEEALDEPSQKLVKEAVEKSGLFSCGAGCKHVECKIPVKLAVNLIYNLWYRAYLI